MSARALSAQFHGTHADLNVGDVISAQPEQNWSQGSGEHAYAVSDPTVAARFGSIVSAARERGWANTDAEVMGFRVHPDTRVYQVEPVDPSDVEPDPNYDDPAYTRSRAGWRVTQNVTDNAVKRLKTSLGL